jgi:hypothetical protein
MVNINDIPAPDKIRLSVDSIPAPDKIRSSKAEKASFFQRIAQAIPGESLIERKGSLGEAFKATPVGQAPQIALGALKGAASTVTGGQEIVQKGTSSLLGFLGAKKAASNLSQTGEQLGEFREKSLTPTTGAQKTGFALEQIAEFLAPGAVAAKALKGGKVLKGIKGLAQASAAEAGTFGGVTALQEGEVGKDAVFSAVIGALFPVAGAAAKPVREALTQKLPSRLMNSLIKPASKEFRFGKDPGGSVAKEGISATTLDGLFKKITKKKNEIGKQISEKAASGGALTDAGKMIDDFLRENDKRIKESLLDEAGEKRFQRVLERLMSEDISSLSGAGLHDLQKRLGNMTQWTGQPFEKEANKLLAALYRKLGVRLETVSPGTKALQRRFANLLSAEKAAENRAAKASAFNALFSLSPQLLGSSVGISTFVSSGDVKDGALAGLATALLTKGVGSTVAKSNIAKLLAQIGKNPSNPTLMRELNALVSEGITNRGK